jgi:hypothetical protein
MVTPGRTYEKPPGAVRPGGFVVLPGSRGS